MLRTLRTTIALSLALTLLWIGVTALRIRHLSWERIPTIVTSGQTSVAGFCTTAYEGARVSARISGASATVANAHLFGPFRLGFLHSLKAQDVTVEVFRDDVAAVEAVESITIERLATLLPRQLAGVSIGYAEIAPIKIIEHRGDREQVVLHAEVCSTSLKGRLIVCENGAYSRDGAEIMFRKLTYAVETRELRTDSS